jgi:hypothetical protein
MALYEPIGGSETRSSLDCLVRSDALPVVLAWYDAESRRTAGLGIHWKPHSGRILWADDEAGETQR